MNTTEQLKTIVAEMKREATDDMPLNFRGIPTIYADIRRWIEALERVIESPPTVRP